MGLQCKTQIDFSLPLNRIWFINLSFAFLDGLVGSEQDAHSSGGVGYGEEWGEKEGRGGSGGAGGGGGGGERGGGRTRSKSYKVDKTDYSRQGLFAFTCQSISFS